MEALKLKWQQYTEREQKILVLGAVFVFVAIIYLAIYAPMNDSIQTNRKAVQAQTELLNWVTQNANKVVQLRASANAGNPFRGSLPQAVNQTASRHSIEITRMQPQGDNIQVWVDRAQFNDVLAWLSTIEQSGINIVEVDLAEADSPGYVKVRRLKLSKI